MTLPALDRRDFRFYAFTCVCFLTALTALYAYAYLSTPEGYVFYGFLYNSHDAYNGMAFANHFAHGGLEIDHPFAAVRQPPAFFSAVWYLLGLLLRTGIPFNVLFHAFQAVAGAALILAVLALMRNLMADRVMAWCATLLSCFGAGFGWIMALIFSLDFRGGVYFTSDIINGDSFPVTGLWTTPHIITSYTIVVLIYLCMYMATTRGGWHWTGLAAALTFLEGFVQTYSLATIFPVLLVWYLVLAAKHGRPFLPRFVNLGILLLAVLPGAIYYKALPSRSPNFAYYGTLIANRSAGFLPVLFGFGLIALLAILGYRGILPVRKFTDNYLLVAVWAVVNFILNLSYPIFVFEAKLGVGLIFPLAILATWAYFASVLPLFRRGASDPRPEPDIYADLAPASPSAPPAAWGRLPWVLALTALTLPTTGLQMANFLHELHTGSPYYHFTLNTRMIIPRGDMEALKFLGANTSGFPLVMVAADSGLLLPGFAPVRAFLGYIGMNSRERLQTAAAFFGARADDSVRRAILARYGIDYVWWGADEDTYGGARPASLPYMAPIFHNGRVTIYRVNRAALPASG